MRLKSEVAIGSKLWQRGGCPRSFLARSEPDAELDLLVVRGNVRLGFEFKRTTAPATTRSMHVAIEDLRLSRPDVVHAGAHSFAMHPKIRAIALSRLFEDLEPLK